MNVTRLIAALLAAVIFWASPAAAQTKYCPKLSDNSLVAPGPEHIDGADAYVYRTVNGASFRLHVLRPAAATKRNPAVVLYMASGWMFGNLKNGLPLAQQLAARGITVILPDIRSHCRDGVDVVDEVGDANAAFRWVHTHAAQLGIDPHRIAASGGSAGGHLALSTAVFPQVGSQGQPAGSGPDLLLLFFPCVDPTSEVEMQYSAAAVAARGAQVNVLANVRRGLPPMLILQGTDDPLYKEVNTFCAKAKAAGDSCGYAEFPGAKHGFFRPGDEHYEPAFARLEAFLVKAGYLKAA